MNESTSPRPPPPPMHILMLNNEYPPLGGGTGTVNKAILDRLLNVEGVSIDIITSALGKKQEEERYAPNVRMIKVPVNNRNIHHSSARELVAYAVRALKEARRRHRETPYDACFAWSAVPAGWVAWQLKREYGLRYLVRVCGVDIPGFERRYRYVYPFLTPILRAVWRAAETVVVKCKGEADMIRTVAPSITPVTIPNGVDLDAFARAAPPAPGETLKLVCVGRLIRRKGQDRLIAALARLVAQGHDARLELVGTGDAEEAYRALAHALGVEDRVDFAGYVPRENIGRHYADAHVFVLPSDNEGMSVSTLEAMASGLPLLVSRTGGTDELVDEGSNGLTFTPGDVDGLVVALARLSHDRALVARMGKAARAKASQFGWAVAVAAYRRLFDDILGGRDAEGETDPVKSGRHA